MIVDCHTHISWPDKDFDLTEHLTAAEPVDICAVLAAPDGTSATQGSAETNKKLSEYVSRHPNKMVGFAVVEPTRDKTDTETLSKIKDDLGLKGAVLYCSRCGFHPAHSKAMQFYESAQELKMPVFFHNGDTFEHDAVLDFVQPYLLDEVARKFPELKIVVGTMGLPFVEQTLALAAKHQNVYADLTIRPRNVWQVYNIVVQANEAGVMNKLLFGSGFPFGRAGQCIETLLGFNKLLADTNLPTVPRGHIQSIIERDVLTLLGIEK